LNNNEDETQGSSNQVLENPQQNFCGGITFTLEVSCSVKGQGHWKNSGS